ncbi:hypothetical protein FALBO_881 [Fusarium albosuccineum]|uniref:F-box domain-containing protein n=1 Tax=Fusarium albosuccineum TaxID=1237068 RepID=A0A8H4PM74_9HYPO|nr:hypothetical protein FALBO_881 [Fusarium albosuccineum]
MAPFDSVPTEIVAVITSYCDFDALVQLSLTCKRINAIVEPCLWSDIELHELGFHESSAEIKVPPPFRLPSQRGYHYGGRQNWPQNTELKAERLFMMLQTLHTRDQNQLKKLASRVKNLCTVINPHWLPDGFVVNNVISPYHLLPYFTNLETLEFHGDWDGGRDGQEINMPDIEAPPLAKLRFAKLFAYIPRPVAAYILRSGATLERLELGMLDRPISSSDFDDPFCLPLPEENLGDEDDPDWGSLSGDSVIPRPLGGFLPNDPLSLPKLKHLYLCQTSDCGNINVREYTWSTRAERASLDSWRELLLASSQTLETLVLEQRLGAEQGEMDACTEMEYLQYYTDGDENKTLVAMLEGIVFEQGAFPELRQVFLNGIAASFGSEGDPSESAPGTRFMRRLKEHNIRCEARRGKWCSFDSSYGSTFWADWTGFWTLDDWDKEEDDDDGPRWDTVLASV